MIRKCQVTHGVLVSAHPQQPKENLPLLMESVLPSKIFLCLAPFLLSALVVACFYALYLLMIFVVP